MSEDKVETIFSESSGSVGRAVNHARGQQLSFDSSSMPSADAFTNSEAFLAGISSCGVTLIELYAQEQGIGLQRTNATISGTRTAQRPADFDHIDLHFQFAGVSEAQAKTLVEVWRGR